MRFGVFEVDLDTGEVRKAGIRQKLAGQPFQLLQALLERPGEIVTRDELRQRIWPENKFVDYDLALKKAVNRVREVLGDSVESPRFIETIPRRGYRFILPVTLHGRNGYTLAVPGPPPAKRTRRAASLLAVAGVALGSSAFALLWISQQIPTLEVGQYARLTNDGRDKSGNISPGIPSPIITDGVRLYFVEPTGGAGISGLVQVSAAGGDIRPVPNPLLNVRLAGISPDRTHLLVGDMARPTAVEAPFYSLPTLGSSMQRLGDFQAHDASWSPNGLRLSYAAGDSLFLARQDGSSAKLLLSGRGAISWPRWSPDGSYLRFTVTQPKTQDNSIWEISLDGKHLREVSGNWSLPGDKCCGSWMPDGKYFVFQNSYLDRSKIYAIPERTLSFSKTGLVGLTPGPILGSAPSPSTDGKKLFFIGSQPRTEPIRYDLGLKRFVPFLSGISTDALYFTRDGQWVAYTQYPEGSLWRSRVDGSQRMQLTSGGVRAFRPRWSPDGTNIVFFGTSPHHPWKLYLLPAKGGTPTQLIFDDANEGDPTWSPDGKKIAFGRLPWLLGASEQPFLYIVDLRSMQVTPVLGSQGLFSPRWSPSGRYLVALNADSTKLMLYDFETSQWRQLAQGMLGNPEWPGKDACVYAVDVQTMTIERIRVSDGRRDPVVNLNSERLAFTGLGPWTGLAPDDSVLALRDLSVQEIYSVELKTH